MDVHIGSSSFLSRSLSKYTKKKIKKISSKKEKNIYRKINIENFKNFDLDFFFFFLGKNFKNKKNLLSKKINFSIPLKLIKKLINKNRKIKIFFFGSFTQFERKSDDNKDYSFYKSELEKAIIKINKNNKTKFEFVWIYCPVIYGYNQPKNYLIPRLLNSIKYNKKMLIHNGSKPIYLLHILDFIRMIKFIKINWTKFKNKSIVSIYEGPLLLKNITSEIENKFGKKNIFIIKKNFKFNKENYNKKIKLNIKYKFKEFLKNVKK